MKGDDFLKNSEIVKKIEQILLEEKCTYKDAVKILMFLQEKIGILSNKFVNKTHVEDLFAKANSEDCQVLSLNTYYLND